MGARAVQLDQGDLDNVSRVKAALLADRQGVVLLSKPGEPERSVTFLRPEEADFPGFITGVTVEHVCEYVNGWAGFSEATFRGQAVGASDELVFDPELWSAYARDHSDEAGVVARAIAAAIKARVEARGLAAKN